MRTRNITVSDDYVPTINLGRQGENAVSQVVFDVSSLITDYGAGTAVVVVRRPTEITTYQHDDTVQSGDTVTWTVTSADTEIAGDGNVQLFWMVNDAVAKTITYQSYVEPALMNPTDAPVSPSGWISEEIAELNEKLNNVRGVTVVSFASEMEDESAIYLYNGTETGYVAGHWYFYDTGTSAWTDGGEYTGWETVETALANYLDENAQEMGTLTISIGSSSYSFNGSASVNIVLPVYNGGVS